MTPAWAEALAAYEAVNGPGPSAFRLASEGHRNAIAIVRRELDQECDCGDPSCMVSADPRRKRLAAAAHSLLSEMDPDGSKRKALDDEWERLEREQQEAAAAYEANFQATLKRRPT